MKKLILFAAFAVSYGVSMAQVSFGVQAGANLAFGKFTSAYMDPLFPTTLTNDPKAGFYAGVLAEIPISGNFAFSPELNFIQKGSKTNSVFYTDDVHHKITLNYVELPLNVVFKVPVGTGNFFFGLGPSLAFGISGTDKRTSQSDPTDPYSNGSFKVNFDGKKYDDITDPNDNDVHFKRFDAGANILAGYKLGNGLFFKLGYNYGFMNIDPNKDNKDVQDQSTYKNRGFNIGVGFMFGGSKNSND